MNELRLKYQYKTGKQVDKIINEDHIVDAYIINEDEVEIELSNWLAVKEYIEWLEERSMITFKIDGQELIGILKKYEEEKGKET